MLKEIFNKYFRKQLPLSQDGFSPVSKKIIRDFNKTRPLNARKHLCNAPFSNMFFSFEGDIFVCCYNQKQKLGIIQDNSIKEAWNSIEAADIRNHIRQSDFINGCDQCKYALLSGQYEAVQISSYDKYPLHPEYPAYMEFQISNVCNLECTMCTGEFSSRIAIEREDLRLLKSPYGSDFLSQLEEFIPYLKHTMFSGGEPFIIPIYFDIWELIHKLNPSCNILVQTNGTILNDKVKKVLEGGVFNIGVSLDSLDDATYRHIRVNASLENTLSNLMYFKDYCHTNKRNISISICPMQQNWHEIPHIVNFCNENGIGIYFCTVEFPGKNALWVLDSQKLEEIVTKLSREKFKVETQIQEVNVQVYKNLIKKIEYWGRIAYKWENTNPIKIDSLEIEKIEVEINKKILDFYAGSQEVKGNTDKKANEMISRLKKTFDLFPNNSFKLNALQFILNSKNDKIISNIFREGDQGFYLVVKNLHRFRDLE